MIIDCISDLHGFYPKTEGGDLLIVAGDLTARDDCAGYLKFLSWLHKQKYKHYIFIAGNHDHILEDEIVLTTSLDRTSYLCDSGMEFEGLKIWGSPWSLHFDGINPKCTAFTSSEELLASKFSLIPDDTDILVTHTPPNGTLDYKHKKVGPAFFVLENVGSESLKNELYRIRPKLHVYGHIHEGYGQYRPNLGFVDCPGYPIYVNASHVNGRYEPVNAPIRVIL